MAHSVLLSTLVTRCQQRANREGDSQLSPAEYKSLISEKYAEMHALVSEKGARYFETEADLNLSNLALPADHLSTLGVDFVISGTTGPRRPLAGPVSVQDRSFLTGLQSGSGPAFYYGIEGGNITLYPTPTSGTYKHLYLPQPTDLSSASDSTSVDLINIYGEKFVIWGVTSIAQHKGEEDQNRALLEEQKAQAQLEYWACQRALTFAPHRPVGPGTQGPSMPWMNFPLDWRWSP